MPVSDDGYVHNMYADRIMNFLRDINGELDVSNETYSREFFTLMKCKYIDKVCLCLGVAVVTTVYLSVGPASVIPKLIHYRVVLFHTPDSGLTDI